MKAAIYLFGLAGIDKPQPLKDVECADEKELCAILKELQKEYCEPSDKQDRPMIQKRSEKFPSGKTVRVLDCYTEVDFHHVAFIGCRIPSPETIQKRKEAAAEKIKNPTL